MVSIRPVKSENVDALYAISLATGLEGAMRHISTMIQS